MYQHLSSAAKDVLQLAQELAHQDKMEYVGTEHILKAILQKDSGTASFILRNQGINAVLLQKDIDLLVKHSSEDTWVLGRLPGTPHFRQVVVLAIEEADKFKDDTVGSEYLLLGLLREAGCIAECALSRAGLDYNRACQHLLDLKGLPTGNCDNCCGD